MNNQNNNRRPVRGVATPYGNVNVNVPKILEQAKQNNGEYKMNRKTLAKRIAAFSGALVLAGGIFVLGRQSAKVEVYLPDNYIMTNVEMTLEDGIIYNVSSQFYDENYATMYPTHKDYTDSIEKLNGVEATSLQENQKLLFPIIFDKNNPHYIAKVSLEKQLNDLENSPEYWIEHEVTISDGSISRFAAEASATDDELYYNISKIKQENGLKTDEIYIGQTLKIINPKVGELRRAIEAEQEALLDSIKVNKEYSQKR